MAMNEREFLKRLLATFKLEADELLQAISSGLVRLEAAPDNAEAIETVFRDAHSLKGAARAVNLAEVARHCHRLEDVFSDWKLARLTPSPALFDALHHSIDLLQQVVAALDPAEAASDYSANGAIRDIDIALSPAARAQPAGTAAEPARLPEEKQEAEPAEALDDSAAAAPRAAPAGKLPRSDTVRIPSSRMDAILLQTEELLGIKLAAVQRASDLSHLGTLMREWTRDASGPGGAGDEMGSTIGHKLSAAARDADRDQRAFSTMLDGLMAELKQALMLPVGTLLEGLPKLVRDLSRDQGKEVDLAVEGDQIEVDRRVLEELRDPIIHIVRNCIDHAIEPPSERLEKNKPARGAIAISALQHENNHFELRIRDDGRGFDVRALKAAAVRRGVLAPEAADGPDPAELRMLAFHSGISTSPILTDVSGRGLGLAIVRNKVERLGGTVALAAPAGGGSEISLRVPISVATFRGVLVKCGGQTFLLPTHSVRKVLRVTPESLESAEGKEILRAGGAAIALARLNHILGLPESRRGNGQVPGALIVEAANSRLALLVDEIVAEQEVLVKSLGKQLARVRHIAGAAILGSGALVPILHLPDIIQTAIRGGAAAGRAQSLSPNEKRKTNVLLAEDSITARTLLKTILETAGYSVFPAVDGAEAWATIRTSKIDLVVSDVEMPRLNGFELTARIRANQELSQIPVILVTALESREDRERGIDAGANAYIVKSSFDQSNLFEAIQRLL